MLQYYAIIMWKWMVGNHVPIDDSYKVVCWLIFPWFFPFLALRCLRRCWYFCVEGLWISVIGGGVGVMKHHTFRFWPKMGLVLFRKFRFRCFGCFRSFGCFGCFTLVLVSHLFEAIKLHIWQKTQKTWLRLGKFCSIGIIIVILWVN